MFNVFAHDKQQKDILQADKKKRLMKSVEPNRELLVTNYKKRISNTLLSVAKDSECIPRPQRSYTPISQQRSFLKSAGFESEHERIMIAEKWNKWLDPTPAYQSGLHLRPRQKPKEIQSHLKFNLKSELERIDDSIQKQLFDTSHSPYSSKKGFYKNYLGIDKPKFSGGKEFRNYYHFKTHFKTIESLAMDLHNSVLRSNEVKEKNYYQNLGIREIGNQKADDIELTKEEVVPASTEIMEKYGYWKCRQLGVGKAKSQSSRVGYEKAFINSSCK